MCCSRHNSRVCGAVVNDLQSTGDAGSAGRRSALSYEPSATPHLTRRGHPAWEGLSKWRWEVAIAITIAIRWLRKSARLHGHRPSAPAPVGAHVHAIAHVHAWRGVSNEWTPRCTLQCTAHVQQLLMMCSLSAGTLAAKCVAVCIAMLLTFGHLQAQLLLLLLKDCNRLYLWGCTSRTCHFDSLEAVVFTGLNDKFNIFPFSQTSEAFRFNCCLQSADKCVYRYRILQGATDDWCPEQCVTGRTLI